MASPTEINVQQLSRLIGTPECPVIVDDRTDEDFDADPRLIPGAFRHPHTDMVALGKRLSGQRVVVSCQAGLKLSEGAAAILRAEGAHAENLVGGHEAWRAANLPALDVSKLPPPDDQGRTVWVTRQRPKVDRIACPWLIRRFIDPNAMFLFVTAGQVEAVADRFGAAPFDIDGVFWSHRGDRCTFDTLIEEFGLGSGALDHLATIVRGADTNRHDLAPQCAGLLAASLGLSRMYRDDLAQLEAGMALYDAFYRWARDATDEGHDWPSQPAKA